MIWRRTCLVTAKGVCSLAAAVRRVTNFASPASGPARPATHDRRNRTRARPARPHEARGPAGARSSKTLGVTRRSRGGHEAVTRRSRGGHEATAPWMPMAPVRVAGALRFYFIRPGRPAPSPFSPSSLPAARPLGPGPGSLWARGGRQCWAVVGTGGRGGEEMRSGGQGTGQERETRERRGRGDQGKRREGES
jgi:hypothetical protein